MEESFVNDGVIGMPEVQADFYDGVQAWSDSCAVAAEASIIRQFGIDLDEENAAYISAQHGWYQPGSGTSPEMVGNIMDMYDIGNHTVVNASAADLAQELSQGHGVIVGVRADQLWEQGAGNELMNFLAKAFGLDTNEYMPADHAIVVTGIDLSDENNPMVLINDTGVPDCKAQPYPLDRFMDAWENSNFYYTATDSALPSMTGDLNSPAWHDIPWGAWIGTGAGVLSFFATGDLDTALETGVTTARILDGLFSEDSFVRSV